MKLMCRTCGQTFFNTGHHAENCDGRPEEFQPCYARATLPERRCCLPYGHTGEHQWRRGL